MSGIEMSLTIDVEALLARYRGRFAPVVRHGDLVTGGGQRPGIAPGGDRLVVDDQNFGRTIGN